MMSKYATNDDLKKLENLLQLLSQKVDKHTTDIKTLYDLIKMVQNSVGKGSGEPVKGHGDDLGALTQRV